MADPLSSSPRERPAPGGAEDDARIDQLLVTGLDQYFAGEYEAAINAWTRVLFLDRHHDRARAYIERARSAQAEHLRASEALVHEGLAAFDRGEVTRARELLSAALARGVSHDIALGVLGRIDRLDVPALRSGGAAQPAEPAPREPRARIRRAASSERTRPVAVLQGWWAAAVLVVAIAAAAALWSAAPESLIPWSTAAPQRPAVAAVPVASLPVPAPAETYLARARELFATGRLRDSLRLIDRVPFGSPLGAEADRLRAEIQRELLAATAVDTQLRPAAVRTPPPE
jgi:tetratricopeptide (TPR) repeat protein